MALPRKFLNEDEELLAELRPHWIFLFGPLFSSIGVWAAIIVLLVLWRNEPSWPNYPILIVALIPGLWLLGRFARWRSYVVALTSTRILVRQGIFGRDTVQLRLQRITEVNLRQALIERVLGTGSLIIDVQGEDDSLTLEYMRKPAVVQRVINSQINEIVGGGQRERFPRTCAPGIGTTRPLRRRSETRRRTRHAALRCGLVPGRTPDGQRRGAGPRARPLRDTGPAHRARRPAPARHHLGRGVRRQEERAARPDLAGPANRAEAQPAHTLPRRLRRCTRRQWPTTSATDSAQTQCVPSPSPWAGCRTHRRTDKWVACTQPSSTPTSPIRRLQPRASRSSSPMQQAPGFVGGFFVALDGAGARGPGLRHRGAGPRRGAPGGAADRRHRLEGRVWRGARLRLRRQLTGRGQAPAGPATVGGVSDLGDTESSQSSAAPRYRCDGCGNLTRFDVTISQKTKAFHHYTVGGDLEIEEMRRCLATWTRWFAAGAATGAASSRSATSSSRSPARRRRCRDRAAGGHLAPAPADPDVGHPTTTPPDIVGVAPMALPAASTWCRPPCRFCSCSSRRAASAAATCGRAWPTWPAVSPARPAWPW